MSSLLIMYLSSCEATYVPRKPPTGFLVGVTMASANRDRLVLKVRCTGCVRRIAEGQEKVAERRAVDRRAAIVGRFVVGCGMEVLWSLCGCWLDMSM
jgi:hypothetical protein